MPYVTEHGQVDKPRESLCIKGVLFVDTKGSFNKSLSTFDVLLD